MESDWEYGSNFSEKLDLLDPVVRYLRNKGFEEGIEESKVEIAKNMLRMEISIDIIVEITGLSREKVLNLE
jgi:predicted transposase/invertase (TIGR01784 family)